MAIKNNFKIFFKLVTILMTIVILIFVFYGLKLGILNDKIYRQNIKGFGCDFRVFYLCNNFCLLFQTGYIKKSTSPNCGLVNIGST